MIFLVSSGKMIFLFPENMIVFFRRKMKDDLSKTKYMEIWYILQMFWKDGLSKKLALECDLSYIMRKDGISFSRKYDIFFTEGKWKMIFLKSAWKYDFFCMLVEVVLVEKVIPRKNDIGILCVFMETFSSFFIYCFPIKKPRKLNL